MEGFLGMEDGDQVLPFVFLWKAIDRVSEGLCISGPSMSFAHLCFRGCWRSTASLRLTFSPTHGGIRFAVNSVRCSPCVSGTTGKK